MPTRGLRNVVREVVLVLGQMSWSLKTHSGEEIAAFTAFCKLIQVYKTRTRKRYAEVVSRFIDYLYQAGIFESPPVSQAHLNDVIDAYVLLLRDGSEITAARIRKHPEASSRDLWLADVADALAWQPLKPASFSNTIAPINHFLQLSESLGRESFERSRLGGVDHGNDYSKLIAAIDGTVGVAPIEVAKMRQNSLFGSVAKFAPNGIRRPRRMHGPSQNKTKDNRYLDFPLTYFSQLIAAATSWRDKALWTLLAASGIRTSEARKLLWDDIDIAAQKVYVLDPEGRRYALPRDIAEEPRFKGRSMGSTYLFPPLRQQFFDFLAEYQRHEYVPNRQPGEPNYVFQYLEYKRRGEPLVNASDTAIVKSFRKAARAAGVPLSENGTDWAPHSLRHLYGVYMLNDYPLSPAEGKFGLTLVEVQMLMGHERISSTRHYARSKQDRLMRKLQASDEALLGLYSSELQNLPIGSIRALELNQ